MLSNFKKYISENKLFKESDRILLAVSGGIDSMVMSHLFLQSGNSLGIAHCNFSLRGTESDKDEQMVREFAASKNIPFYSKKFETKLFAGNNGLSIQMAARELRYTWFEEVRYEHGYDHIAVAHNLNDNIETLLINLIRGTGITGLTGMKPSNNKIIRPLLFARRDEISAFCKNERIFFREDMTNADTIYTRNKIRHLVIPVLKEINPSIESTLNETAERFTGINEILIHYVSELRGVVSEKEGDLIIFNYTLLKQYLNNKTIVYELFKPYGITNLQLDDIIKVIAGKTGGQIFTETHRILKNRKEILVSYEQKREINLYTINSAEELMKIPGIATVNFIDITDNFEIPFDRYTACIDAEKISFPLIIRKWIAGDNFYPFGMKQKKKLSDYFIDNKYSILEKEDILILESDGKIVWLIGDRLDNRFRITKSTKRALIIRSRKKKPVIKPVR